MAFNLTWNSGAYDFTEEVEDIPSISDDTDIATERVPRRHGVYVSEEPSRRERTINFRGMIVQTTAALARARLDTLLYQLNLGKKQLRFNSSRYINCYKRGFKWRFANPALTAVAYDIEFMADDPFFYSVSATSDVQPVTYNPTSWAHANGGDEIIFPIITIAPSGSNITSMTFTNSTTGKSFSYSGTIVVGQSLVVDCGRSTCKNNGVADLANFSGTFLWLVNGSNTLQQASTNCTVTVAYNGRYNAPAWD